MSEELISWVIIPLLIMVARIIDVSIGTVRIILISRGKEKIAAILGFFEVIIWLCAISEVMKNLNNVACYIAYGAGFGMGTLVGVLLEKRLAIGVQIIRIITETKLQTLQMVLRDEGYGVTTVQGQGGKGAVDVIYVVAERKEVGHILDVVRSIEPDSFITTQAIDHRFQGFFAKRQRATQLAVK